MNLDPEHYNKASSKERELILRQALRGAFVRRGIFFGARDFEIPGPITDEGRHSDLESTIKRIKTRWEKEELGNKLRQK